MKQLYYFFTALALVAATTASAGEIDNFNMGWRFSLNSDVLENVRQDFDDSGWRELNLPHDWAIEGDFDQSNPSTDCFKSLSPKGVGSVTNTT
jgi:beta-galactosidase